MHAQHKERWSNVCALGLGSEVVVVRTSDCVGAFFFPGLPGLPGLPDFPGFDVASCAAKGLP